MKCPLHIKGNEVSLNATNALGENHVLGPYNKFACGGKERADQRGYFSHITIFTAFLISVYTSNSLHFFLRMIKSTVPICEKWAKYATRLHTNDPIPQCCFYNMYIFNVIGTLLAGNNIGVTCMISWFRRSIGETSGTLYRPMCTNLSKHLCTCLGMHYPYSLERGNVVFLEDIDLSKLSQVMTIWRLICTNIIKEGDLPCVVLGKISLTHWGRDEMDAISQTPFSRAFSSKKIVVFWLNFHWNMFARVQLTIFQHWFR